MLGARAAEGKGMEPVALLTDTDPTSLDERIRHTLRSSGPDCVVRRFTYWYTGRDCVHEAVVMRPAGGAR